MTNYVDADFLKNYIQHTEDEITVSAFGARVIKIKKMTSLESKMMGNLIVEQFGRDNFEKYYAQIEQIRNDGKSNAKIEAEIKKVMGSDYESFAEASQKAIIFKVSASTGFPIELIEQLDQSIILEISQKIDKAFSVDIEDLQKK